MTSTGLRKRRLGRQGLDVAEIGFGAMGISVAYGEAIRRAGPRRSAGPSNLA
ncbi:MAG TPA: hypothetical protein VHV09_20035 [Trebonia sp.]|jgi:aryl-alcohol dehydrogenase-like predicted oxidoreductase|nr:hypothetical protein [Trebonia sp.]